MVKNPPANAGDAASIPWLGRSLGGGHGNPRQYSCWEIAWTEEPGRLGSQRVGQTLERTGFRCRDAQGRGSGLG